MVEDRLSEHAQRPHGIRAAVERTGSPGPTRLSFSYNAINDELAHIQPIDQLLAYYCAHGATIDYDRDPVGGSHVGGLAGYWPLALQYLEDRLAGKPAPDNCPR